MTITMGNQTHESLLPEGTGSVMKSVKATVTGYFSKRKIQRPGVAVRMAKPRLEPKPAWAHVPQRSWKRHSAYLMYSHEIRND